MVFDGQFRSWPPARRAAGFQLLGPTRTYGLHRAGPIAVTRCEFRHQYRKRVVTAIIGSSAFHTIIDSQNNSGGPCQVMGQSHRLRTVRVDGTTGWLTGPCAVPHFPKTCSGSRLWLFISWRKSGVFDLTASYGEWARTLIGFVHGPIRVR